MLYILPQFIAIRSVEQSIWLMKQLNPAVMSRETIESVALRMSGQPALHDKLVEALNTYNHIHTELKSVSQQHSLFSQLVLLRGELSYT